MNIIIGHSNTDLDCLSSMLLAKKLYTDYNVVLCDLINPVAGNLIGYYKNKINFLTTPDLKDQPIENVVIVDTSSSSRVKEFIPAIQRATGKIIIYDHHPGESNDIPGSELKLVNYGSNTTNLAMEIIEKGITLDMEEATIALTGIYSDTLNFTIERTAPEDFEAARFFVSMGASIKLVKYFLKPLKKNYQISYFHRVLNSLVFRNINGHEIILCNIETEQRLNGLAAVVEKVFEIENPEAFFAVFYSKKEKVTNIIARSQRSSIRVNELLKDFGGGGHDKAASATIKKSSGDEVYSKLIDVLGNLVPAITAETIMNRLVKYIPDTVNMNEAAVYLEEINHTAVPVLDGNHKIVGMLGNKDVKNAEKANCMQSPVKAYMSKKVITIPFYATMRDIERVFLENKYNHMPVVNDDNDMVGILTRKDFLRVLHEDNSMESILQSRS